MSNNSSLRSSQLQNAKVPNGYHGAGSSINNDNFYELQFSIDQTHAFSSALSAKNSGNPYVEVKIPAIDGTSATYQLHCHCNYYSVISISQVNGSIAVSQNL